ncbi:MAG: response regulator [Verrucomicrobia bacterium]|nr:response regulator [Verrucomicrobiota bacterium]
MLVQPTRAPDTVPCFSVLVVEDTKQEVELIRRRCFEIIERSVGSYSFLFEPTGDEGWATAEAIPFDFYIIDGNTPGNLQGPEVCRKIIAKYPNAQVVLYTGMTEDEITEAGGLPKSVTVLEKRIASLVKVVQDQVCNYRASRNGRKNSADTCLG